jgi:polyhydroxyalkanoate synthesis repressor PhaR
MTAARIIKKYPNRRLYDTQTSAYITLAEIKKLVLEQTEFQVFDAKTNQDITRSILMQIILEEEGGGSPLFSSQMLTQMIRCYGNAMQGAMGAYLEKGIQGFVDVQQKLREQSASLFGASPGAGSEGWAQFLKTQAPALQGLMGNYLERSAGVFLEIQSQVQKQAREIFAPVLAQGTPSAAPEPSAAKPEAEAEPAKKPARPKRARKKAE